MKTSTASRWSIVNRNTGKVRRSAPNRASARLYKKANERILDNVTGAFVR